LEYNASEPMNDRERWLDAWANADGGVIAPTIPIVAVVAVPPDLNCHGLGM
jgi:hypothetical protein